MDLRKNDRTAVFIDGANLHSTAKALEWDVDFKKVHEYFLTKTNLVRILYYTALLEGSDFAGIRKLTDWLDYNGYSVVTKLAKEYRNADGRTKIKGNMDNEMTVNILRLAKHLDRVVLFTGDGDFRYLVESIQSKEGVRVTVISTMKTRPPMIADELRRQADEFIELDLLKNEFQLLKPSKTQG